MKLWKYFRKLSFELMNENFNRLLQLVLKDASKNDGNILESWLLLIQVAPSD